MLQSNESAVIPLLEQGTPFLDAATIRHGPRGPLEKFFLSAGAMASRLGLQVKVHDDMGALAAVNDRLRPVWSQIAPAFNPSDSDVDAHSAFWISVQDEGGRLVSASAARLIDLGSGTFADTLTSLRLWYRDPGPQLAKGTRCTIEGPAMEAATAITGRVTYSGGLWTHPDFRGRGVAYILPRINRYLALARWDTSFTAAVLKVDLAAKGLLGRYGYQRSERLVHLTNSYMGDLRLSLIWMDRTAMETDLATYVQEVEGTLRRTIEADETSDPIRDDHGSMRR